MLNKNYITAICLGIFMWCCQSSAALPGNYFAFASMPMPIERLISKPVDTQEDDTAQFASATWFEKKSNGKTQIRGINPRVWRLAFAAYNKARANGYGKKEIFTVVDYSLPSTARRLWVINMRTKEVLFNTYVAHGLGSGNNYATQFSNRPGSKMSSLGMFLTDDIYHGNYGPSLNLIGLEQSFNSNAKMRRIVFHRAHYVDEAIIKRIGRLGRSFGCLALNAKVADKIMRTIKEGSLVFCYYPDPKWLRESKLL